MAQFANNNRIRGRRERKQLELKADRLTGKYRATKYETVGSRWQAFEK
jgi:hypothetical protein